ncbi:cupredoxin domain-containing protein [Bacillus andreraoultii]|uniref:cupredoxin domain-containing protein n=1 Tax=Bacillus andreraoultii TaxID=1499685 RepID=UPI000AF3AF87
MSHFTVIRGRQLGKFIIFVIFIVAAFIWYSFQYKVFSATDVVAKEQIREIHMVTGEFSTKTATGKKIEAYRFDPGTIFLEKDEKVLLKIYGVNGEEHPFIIEGTDIKGTVKKGKETTIPLTFKKEGTYRLICVAHPDYARNGPMIAYIVVD